MEIIPLIISLVSGGAGGNIAGGLLKKANMGKVLNTIVGLIGGGGGGMLLKMLMGGAAAASGGDAGSASDVAEAVGGFDFSNIGAILQQVGGSAGGGAILTVIIGFIKNMMSGGGSAE